MDLSQSLLFAARFASGDYGPAEHSEFLAWAAEATLTELESVARVYEQAGQPSIKMPGDLWTIQLEEKLNRITPVKRIIHWRRLAAAAAIFILVSTGAYFLFFNNTTKQPAFTENKKIIHDIAPGANKAILTLGNGSKIILDSAHNGLLAKQGNSDITKTDSGKLAYVSTEKSSEIFYNTLTTPRGGQYQLLLSDGTKVWLDAVSSITYPTAFTGKIRKVEVSGQAYFEVAHKATMPFIVSANGMEIREIGTSFNINTYSDEPASRITLVEGSISIKKNNQNLLLKPGDQAVLNNSKLEISKTSDLEQVLAWKNGQFKLDGAGIHEIMRQVSRWYDVDISYEGNLDKAVFSGIVSRRENVSGLVKILEATGSVHFKIEERKITVKP